MTSFGKPIHRRTRGLYAVLYRKARHIVVTLAPGDLIQFREAGRRTRWSLPADTAFKYAVRLAAWQAAAEKKRKKNAPK